MGAFRLLIPPFYGERSLQYVGAFSDSTGIQLSNYKVDVQTPELQYSPSILNYIEESRKRKLIYQLFNKTENFASFQSIEEPSLIEADREFNSSDYPFETLMQFCKEISTPFKYIKQKKTAGEFKMFNPESRNFYFGNPLFIIDGVLTKDMEFLTSIDFQSLDEIKLYYDNQKLSNQFGFAGFSGVVIIKSKEGMLEVPVASTTQVFQLQGLQPVLEPNFQFSNDSKDPLFKPQLFWEPNLTTDNNGKASLSFQQSDDISIFQVEIFAQDQQGRRGVARVVYSVTP